LVPTEIVVEAARSSHLEWLRSNPDTNGKNRTWNLWFDDDGPAKANGFAEKWAKYRLTLNSKPPGASPGQNSLGNQKLGDVIAEAKRRIADAAGIPENSVKISIDLS
jgi:hypothetical protein